MGHGVPPVPPGGGGQGARSSHPPCAEAQDGGPRRHKGRAGAHTGVAGPARGRAGRMVTACRKNARTSGDGADDGPDCYCNPCLSPPSGRDATVRVVIDSARSGRSRINAAGSPQLVRALALHGVIPVPGKPLGVTP
ncbi:hypothetical protein SCATT_p04930 (plasmid) [Streptantibioticus cattleyicolor NRRL 8057 = DSM 46488]|uniref:Uncharacterized protein n=1 Tax=Streptantibioticus cattleyicolor (strain ATCC 35852 / DSM 46488 / JCM 4925 / NBRC 14057 / NRRL 8057) TaxID=1003195 RepID=G8WMM0_STREN|nr:hypothetical protein SCATT_02180 [Streptantibioticus cattleyicolor NRRL 8057 = DSM 46488]AEW98686.1 hypothetical protein SCATT_p04930 [Streptantibioticus cattleyicolor NRRL 8057 = DSM 46488]